MNISNTFAAYKRKVGGPNHGEAYGHVRGLTFSEASDIVRFPLGIHKESDGSSYVWTFGANDGVKFWW